MSAVSNFKGKNRNYSILDRNLFYLASIVVIVIELKISKL